MSRATLVLVILLVLFVALLVWLSARPATIPPHPIEKAVTLDDAGSGAAH